MDNLYNGRRVLYVLTEADLECVWDDLVREEGLKPRWDELTEHGRAAIFDSVQDALDASMDGWYETMAETIMGRKSYE